MTNGRVFHRSSLPDPLVAVRARARRSATRPDASTWTRPGRDRRQRRARPGVRLPGPRRAGRPAVVCPRLRVHDRAARGLRRGDRAAPAGRRSRDLPGQRRSEAIETALKLARAYHLARGEPERWVVYARWGSYHGNTLGALDLSGRSPLRRPYEGWLGRFRHVSAAYPYRGSDPDSSRRSRRPRSSPPSWRRRSPPPSRDRSPRSSPSRSSARPWPPPCRPTTTGRRSPTSAGAMGSS